MNVENKSSNTTLERDSIARARNLMLLTAKTLRSIKIYPSNSPVIKDQKEFLNRGFQSYLTTYQTLTITISESGLLIDDQVIYEDETRGNSLSFLLYNDGLREISFYEGITQQELDEFLEALAENWFEAEETDVASSLWERDFNNISYVAIDEIFSDLAEPTDTSSGQGGIAASKITTGDKRELSSGTITLRDEDGEQLKGAGSGITGVATEEMNTSLEIGNVLLLDDQDLEKIEKIVNEDTRDFNPPREFAEALFDLLVLEEDPNRYNSVLKILEEYLSELISNANFGTASQILLALIEIKDSPSCQSSKYKMLVKTILERARSAESIKKVRQLLHKETIGSLDNLFNYISLLGASATPILIDILMQMKDPEIHSRARNLLVDFGRTDVGYFREWLSDSRAHLVKQIVSILGQVGVEAIPHLGKCLNHPDTDIRRETVRSLSRIGGMSANLLLVKFLSDPNPDVRILTLRSFSNPDPETIESICSLIHQDEFAKKDIMERKAWVDFLRKTGSDSVVPVLRSLLIQRSWFRRRVNNEFKVFVVWALASIATESARKALFEGTRMRNRKVRNACKQALQRVRRANQEEKTSTMYPPPTETTGKQ